MSYLAHRGAQGRAVGMWIIDGDQDGTDPAIVPSMNTVNSPSNHPTACLPPVNAPAEHMLLAARVAMLAQDLRNGRISETDQLMIAAMLKVLGC